MTIGLEIHAELKTKSKMFCGCRNSGMEENLGPNINICPVCTGQPGTLPVINKEAVHKVLLIGTAIGGKLANFTEFDRKNYFYPDIPKGYQISQYQFPLVSGGLLSGVSITRIHLEEDTARSSHDKGDYSLVDFNRAGVPLMELVTEPVIHSAEEASTFAKELQLLLRYLDLSEANMEKGEMRVEVNFSISENEKLGTKVEIKNLNSFRSVSRAIEYEFERQKSVLEDGGVIKQETRGWDESNQKTFSQRSKEDAHDYRYFPEPDLPKLMISEISDFSPEKLIKELPELPWQKRNRLSEKFGLKTEDIEMYVGDEKTGRFFEEAALIAGAENASLLSNYISSDLVGLSKKNEDGSFGNITAETFANLIKMVVSNELSSRGAKDVLKIMFDSGGEPRTIAERENLIQKNDLSELKQIMEIVIEENPKTVGEYKSGKESVLQYFIGQGMKKSKGSANPEILKKIILEILAK